MTRLSDIEQRSLVRANNDAPVSHELPSPLQAEGQYDKGMIAELAYILYEERGREDGHDLNDWCEAEAALASIGSYSVGSWRLCAITGTYKSEHLYDDRETMTGPDQTPGAAVAERVTGTPAATFEPSSPSIRFPERHLSPSIRR